MTSTVGEVLFGSDKQIPSQPSGAFWLVVSALAPALPAGANAAEEIRRAFDIPVGNLLLDVWQQHREIDAAKRQTAGKPDAVRRVKMLARTLTSKRKATIKLTGAGATLFTADFDLVLHVEFESCTLLVQNGALAAIEVASARAKAALKRGSETLIEHDLADIELPDLKV